jgi:hypothetical protein
VKAVEKVRGLSEEELRAPFLGLPIANHDNNQHSANENIRLANLWSGIDVTIAVMTASPTLLQ